MKIAVCFVILVAFFTYAGHSQSYGLQFASHEVVQEKRTGLNLSPVEPLCLTEDGELSFDLQFAPRMETYFGYVFRIITTDHQNIDLVYNQKLGNFNFIIGETVAGTFRIDSPRLYTQWSQVALHFATKDKSLGFYVNQRLVGKSKAPFKGDPCFRLVFGTSGVDEFQTADIPPMSIRNIRVAENRRLRYYWPLSEASGEESRDSVGNRPARVTNAIWIRSRHQDWALVNACQINGIPAIAFDPGKELLYLVTPDSLYSFSLSRSTLSGVRLADPDDPTRLPAGHQAIFDPAHDRLYDAYIDQKTVRTWLGNNNRWDGHFLPGPLTEFWHANKFLSPKDSAVYMIGGYGQLHYKNLVQRYDIPQKKWEVVTPRGDHLPPHYLGALGTNSTGDTAWLLGGYGSNTGDQMVNPKYYYDLYAYSIGDQRIRTVYHLKEPEKQFCFANSTGHRRQVERILRADLPQRPVQFHPAADPGFAEFAGIRAAGRYHPLLFLRRAVFCRPVLFAQREETGRRDLLYHQGEQDGRQDLFDRLSAVCGLTGSGSRRSFDSLVGVCAGDCRPGRTDLGDVWKKEKESRPGHARCACASRE
ncbi:hypothetical protein ACQ86N_11935 [Puia sp. P3]|uniref:hypothetical protein n=1 Tax=Puia sp. P3 TaxID=3423952 RepID=UPI003D67B042